MKTAKKIELPVLKDVVVKGRDVPETDELPSTLSEIQEKALQQQIEKIVRAKLEPVLNKATKEVVKEIKIHLDKVLPTLIKAANKSVKERV
jgi:hypothetical protein